MALVDFLKGPEHRKNSEILKAELQELQRQSQEELRMQQQKYQEEVQALQQKSQNEIQAITSKYNDLEAKVRHIGVLDLTEIQKKIQEEKNLLSSVQTQIKTAQYDLQMSFLKLEEAQKQILGAEDTVLLESFALYAPKYQFTNSAEYKERLEANRNHQKEIARGISKTVDSLDNYAVELNKSEWKKLRKGIGKLAMRSFNSESEYCVDNVKFNNMEKMETRIRRSFDTCNSLMKSADLVMTDLVLGLKLNELHLAHEYQMNRHKEKEAARQAREDQREQEKLEKEIREARAKIEKERRHFTGALQKLQLRLNDADTQQERDSLRTRIDELSTQNNKLDEEEKLLDYREQNARAGYVYVISNIGAFGEHVYKIGMTRRLEPMDRVDELGDASVPFRFDVHAMVFSHDAPGLEAKLHSHFAAGRLNKVNGRKEFFRADLAAIEAVIRTNYDAVVEVIHAAPAEQYRESLRLATSVG